MFPAMLRTKIRTDNVRRKTNEGKGSGTSRLEDGDGEADVVSSIDRDAVTEFFHVVLVAKRVGLAEVMM